MGGNMAVKTDFDGSSPDRFGILDKYRLEPGYYKLGLRYWKGVGDSGHQLFTVLMEIGKIFRCIKVNPDKSENNNED